MSKFEEFFDDFMGKAKSVYGTASKMTGEMVDMGKIHYQIKQTQWEIEKTYQKLGEIVYESKKSAQSFDEAITLAVAEVDALNERLEDLGKRLRAYKKVRKCPDCGKENDEEFTFCSRCGAGLETVEQEPIEVEAQEVQTPEE